MENVIPEVAETKEDLIENGEFIKFTLFFITIIGRILLLSSVDRDCNCFFYELDKPHNNNNKR